MQKRVLSTLKNSPSTELLRLKNRDWIIEFFMTIFDKEHTNISFENLQLQLCDFLNHYQQELEEGEKPLPFESIEEKAKRTITQWTNKGFLTSYPDENGDIFYELSHHTNKTIDWLSSLIKKEFIGADSKLKDLFNKLKELVEFSNEDVGQRIKILENKRFKLKQEIEQLKISDNVTILETHEISARFDQLTQYSKELLSDFSEVEENFKKINKNIHQKHIDKNLTKGDILGFTFDALDELKNSHQGKSFYGFWRFLIDAELQDEWLKLVEMLYQILQEKGINDNDLFLRSMKNRLYTYGQKVYRANDKMAEKLSRIIRENYDENKAMTSQTIKAIKYFLVEISKTPHKPDISIIIEENAMVNTLFERQLTLSPKEQVNYNAQPIPAKNDLSQSTQLHTIFNQTVVNTKLLKNNILSLLKTRSQTTLFEVINNNGGIKQGLPEVFGYFSVLKDFTHNFNINKQQEIIFDTICHKSIKIPEIIIIK
ncbi:MAG: DUF3375 family protein [Gammaproteobacteria bacterium]|nr:DUF3375 family protein [Gammaproteobacteria bacterium]